MYFFRQMDWWLHANGVWLNVQMVYSKCSISGTTESARKKKLFPVTVPIQVNLSHLPIPTVIRTITGLSWHIMILVQISLNQKKKSPAVAYHQKWQQKIVCVLCVFTIPQLPFCQVHPRRCHRHQGSQTWIAKAIAGKNRTWQPRNTTLLRIP